MYIRGFITEGCMSKGEWKIIVWDRACDLDNASCNLQAGSAPSQCSLFVSGVLLTSLCHRNWWQLPDTHQQNMGIYETVYTSTLLAGEM